MHGIIMAVIILILVDRGSEEDEPMIAENSMEAYMRAFNTKKLDTLRCKVF